MSYSRWGSRGSGHWYTYWCVQPHDSVETRDNALFDICSVATFTAKQLRDDIEDCLCRTALADPIASDMHIDELRTYIEEFLMDVDERYPDPPPPETMADVMEDPER